MLDRVTGNAVYNRISVLSISQFPAIFKMFEVCKRVSILRVI